ncbi:MAG: hypothetical protein ACOX2F_05750 [bacterium]
MNTGEMNKYQYIRAIRFKVKEINDSGQELLKKRKSEKEVDIKKLVEELEVIPEKLNDLLYCNKILENGKEEKKLFDRLEVKKNWLLLHHKSEFIGYTKSSNVKKYKLSKLKLKDKDENYFSKQLEDCLKDWKYFTEELRDYSERPEESQKRRSEVAYAIKSLLNKKIMRYLSELLGNLSSGNQYLFDRKRDDLKIEILKIKEDLQTLEEITLPSQSAGIELACASFNYFTVNKKPKEYFDKEIEKVKQEKNKKFAYLDEYKLKKGEDQRSLLFIFRTQQEKEWLDIYMKKNDIDKSKLTIGETVTILANFKSDQKSILHEVLNHSFSKDQDKEYKTKNEKLSVGNYEICYQSIKDINSLSNQFSLFFLNNNTNLRELLRLKKEKKSLKKFFWGNYALFERYRNLCSKFREISQKNGQLITRINNLKKQKLESQKGEYWSMLFRDIDRTRLLLIPKSKIMDARKEISFLNESEEGNIFVLKSLTMRALEKLCFAEESSFIEEMKEIENINKYGHSLKKLYEDQKSIKTMKTTDDNNSKDQKIQEKRFKKLEFYKEIIQHSYTKDRIDLNFDLLECLAAKDLNAFEQSLEKACYKLKSYNFSKEQLDEFIEKYSVLVFDITSFDLEERNKSSEPQSEYRTHTKIWHQFWNHESNSKYGEVRLNPELRVNYRERDRELQQFFEEKGFPESFKHRRLQKQFTLTFTFALQTGNIYEDLSFIKPEDQLSKINEFNKDFRKKMPYDSSWRYGIDVGQIELATLCLTRKTQEIYSVNNKSINKYEFQKFDVYELKNLEYTETYDTASEKDKIRYAVKNPSYFIDKEELFEHLEKSTLDLSAAKLIKDKIVENGDLTSYLKLQKLVAKKEIYELFHRDQKDFQDTFFIELSKRMYGNNENKETLDFHVSIIFEGKDDKNTQDGRTLFSYKPEWENVIGYTPNDILESLKKYLEDLKILENKRRQARSEKKEIRIENLHAPTHEQINSLRNSLVANMVGIICHLQRKYPGYVFLEDLKKETINNQFNKNNLHIARKLEFALYKKFQSLGLIPPHIKDIINLREAIRDKSDEKHNCQFGAMIFINEKDTSKTCPYCCHVSERDNETKMGAHTWKCNPKDKKITPCGFYTKSIPEKMDWLKDVDNPDSLAAFNIARKIDSESDLKALTIQTAKNE